MKKVFALCLAAVLCLCCLASCGSAHKENTWFSEDKLTECLVGDLPTITKDYVSHNDEDIYVSFTSKEREAYVAEVFEYLKSQNFKYFGTRGEQVGTLAGTLTTYYFRPATELRDFYVGSAYKFVYSNGTLDENGDLIFCIINIYDYETKNLEYGTKNFSYNTLITLRYKSEAPLSGFYVLKEAADAPDADGEQFTAYKNFVTKDEFKQQYEQAYKKLQPDYTKDFVYIYSNAFTEITETGEDRSTTNERTEYDADSQIVLFHHEFQNNEVDAPANENYLWEYREKEDMLQFYDSRTSKTETRSLGFDEFWEFAHSRIPFALFPNPYKLFDNTTYYIDLNEDGTTVFTLYSGDENDYSLRQIVFTGAEMLYISKRYTKEADYEDITFDIYRVYNEEVTLTPISE